MNAYNLRCYLFKLYSDNSCYISLLPINILIQILDILCKRYIIYEFDITIGYDYGFGCLYKKKDKMIIYDDNYLSLLPIDILEIIFRIVESYKYKPILSIINSWFE